MRLRAIYFSLNRAVTLTTKVNKKRLHKQLKYVHLGGRAMYQVIALSPSPVEKIDEANFMTDCLNFLRYAYKLKNDFHWRKECCQLRDFSCRCYSRSHEISKFNSKCGLTFSNLVPEDQLEAISIV